jgi:hypothetical protein
MNPPQRLRAIGLVPQPSSEPVEERSHPNDTVGIDRRDRHAINTTSAAVVRHLHPRPPQDVAAGDLVVERVERSMWILLGTAIQHALKRSNLVHLLGFADGPSRSLGTHQGSSLFRRAPMK